MTGLGAAASRVPARGLALGPRARRRLAVLLAACAILAAAYMLWLRDSGLVKVERVTVTGLSGEDAARARAALSRAGLESTTLHVDHEAISRAAEAFPTIRWVQVDTDFPDALAIRVIEHRPAALLVAGARKVPVAGDGTILPGLPTRGALPEIRVAGSLPPRKLEAGAALEAARIAGAAPAPFTRRIERVVRRRDRGLVVKLRKGPEIVFGDVARLGAKWAAALRVLADRDSAGADYVDVRIPGRPAAGGLPVQTVAPVAPAGATPAGTAGAAPPAEAAPEASPPATAQPEQPPVHPAQPQP